MIVAGQSAEISPQWEKPNRVIGVACNDEPTKNYGAFHLPQKLELGMTTYKLTALHEVTTSHNTNSSQIH